MKVIIVGAGIGGLSTYLALKKHLLSLPNSNHQVKIYEAYDINKSTFSSTPNPTQSNEPVFTPEAIGSAIGISTNGLNVLQRLATPNCDFYQELLKRGHPVTRWEMSNARGWLLADVNLVSKSLRERSAGAGVNAKGGKPGADQDGGAKKNHDEDWVCSGVMITRQGCWEMLRDEVVKDNVFERRKVVDVVIGRGNELNVVKFADGEETADLVIGADGLRSVVRRAMFEKQQGDEPVRKQNSKSKSLFSWLWSSKETLPDYTTPHYEGLVGVGGYIPSSLLSDSKSPPGTMSIVFGPNGFFGYGYITSDPNTTMDSYPPNTTFPSALPGPLAVYWSTFSSPTENPFPLPNTTPKPYAFDKEAALSALLSRHRSWENPTIQAILDHVKKNGVEGFYPTWTTPELPTWQRDGKVVLIGDAAHTLQPSSGQGACQALEDAEALALLLRHCLAKEEAGNAEALTRANKKALEKFMIVRKPRVHAIWERSQKMSKIKGDMGFFMEMMMYLMIWLMTFFHDDYSEKLFMYDLPKEVEKTLQEEGSN